MTYSHSWLANNADAKEEYVIFASDQSATDTDHYLQACNIGHKRLVGSWEGVKEPSWIINANDFKRVSSAFVVKQVCILHLGPVIAEKNARLASLEWFDGYSDKEPIGFLFNCSQAYANGCDGWTYDPSQDQYHVAQWNKPKEGFNLPR